MKIENKSSGLGDTIAKFTHFVGLDKLVERITKEMKKNGKLNGEVKDLIIKSFREFYTIMYQQRSFWESKFKGL
jgi:hypothetical protein